MQIAKHHNANILVTQAGCIAAGVGQGVQLRLSACLFVRALKGKRLELSAPKSIR